MELKEIVAKNICDLRKIYKMTQAELAEKLNYSDKAVSKWERAEALPDVETIKKMADIFDVSVDCLLTENADIKKNIKTRRLTAAQKFLITIISAVLVWVVATAAYVFLSWAGLPARAVTLSFIYAIPVTFIVLIVFNGLWGKIWATLIFVTGLLWTVALSIFLTPAFVGVNWREAYLIFIGAIPVQIGLTLFFGLRILNDIQKKKAEKGVQGIDSVKKKLALNSDKTEKIEKIDKNEKNERLEKFEKSDSTDGVPSNNENDFGE